MDVDLCPMTSLRRVPDTHHSQIEIRGGRGVSNSAPSGRLKLRYYTTYGFPAVGVVFATVILMSDRGGCAAKLADC